MKLKSSIDYNSVFYYNSLQLIIKYRRKKMNKMIDLVNDNTEKT